MIATSQVTVGTTAIPVSPPASTVAARRLTVRNTGTADVYLGPAGVTTSTGYPLAGGATFTTSELADGDRLHAVAAVSGSVAYISNDTRTA